MSRPLTLDELEARIARQSGPTAEQLFALMALIDGEEVMSVTLGEIAESVTAPT